MMERYVVVSYIHRYLSGSALVVDVTLGWVGLRMEGFYEPSLRLFLEGSSRHRSFLREGL